MVAESDLAITQEHIPKRFERIRTNFKIFRTTFRSRAINAMALVPSLTPIPPETLDREKVSIGSFILRKEIGVTSFRIHVSEYMTEVLERQGQREASPENI